MAVIIQYKFCVVILKLKGKLIHLFKFVRVYTALIYAAAPINRFRHRHFDIFAVIPFLPIHLSTQLNQIFFHFWTLVLHRNGGEKNYKSEYRAGNIMRWFCRAMKLCIISVKIYVAIMVKVTFEIKSNI